VGLEDGSKKATSLCDRDAIKACVVASFVRGLLGVDVGEENVSDDGGGVQRDGAGEGSQGEERNDELSCLYSGAESKMMLLENIILQSSQTPSRLPNRITQSS